jgi:hypothetical protein
LYDNASREKSTFNSIFKVIKVIITIIITAITTSMTDYFPNVSTTTTSSQLSFYKKMSYEPKSCANF